ncbi:hypothetical protein BD311DRAFT_861752 [Dichomitus squalens]|uniref:Uncharacterized protein n=1 Tax=Dichomitus squalens TaxID=114155 RepID=A0A4Q9N548_9APHY|nr:hypothetical protein BD311DRAFT_861752 [Dichomitus squalens]
MNRRYIGSLEPYLGDYLIVWDSACGSDCREDNFPAPHLGDGTISINYAKPSAWVKEQEPPVPSARPLLYTPPKENAVITVRDPYLGLSHGRTSTTVKPAAFSVRRRSLPLSDTSSGWSGDSDTLVEYALKATSRENHWPNGSCFWRFDWKRRAPTLGYRTEGMDMTTDEGHALSFTDAVDDHGFPFAIIELRGTEDVGCIVVLAKKQTSTHARKYLSLTEKMRLGMHDVRCRGKGDFEDNLRESLRRASKEYVPRKPFGPVSV